MSDEIKHDEQVDGLISSMSREDLFKTEPDNFKHLSEIDICITKPNKDNQRMIFVGTPSAFHMGGLIFLVLRHCLRMLDGIELQRLQEKDMIAKVNQKGFRGFLRGGR